MLRRDRRPQARLRDAGATLKGPRKMKHPWHHSWYPLAAQGARRKERHGKWTAGKVTSRRARRREPRRKGRLQGNE